MHINHDFESVMSQFLCILRVYKKLKMCRIVFLLVFSQILKYHIKFFTKLNLTKHTFFLFSFWSFFVKKKLKKLKGMLVLPAIGHVVFKTLAL